MISRRLIILMSSSSNNRRGATDMEARRNVEKIPVARQKVGPTYASPETKPSGRTQTMVANPVRDLTAAFGPALYLDRWTGSAMHTRNLDCW